MNDETVITLDNEEHKYDASTLPLITVDDVRQQIELIEKSAGSIKNIKAGFNKMLQIGLIDGDRLQEQFSSKGFPLTLLEVKNWVAQNNTNKQWPSFLNDIKQAISGFTFSISDDSSFADTIRFFAYRKLGSHLSDKKIADEIVKSEFLPNVEGQHESLTRLNFANSYVSWLKGRYRSSTGDFQPRFKCMDDFLGAGGRILEKGMFLVLLHRNTGQGGSNGSLSPSLDLPDFIEKEIEVFSRWKIQSSRPKDPVQFSNLNTQKKREIRATNNSPWTIDSDGISNSKNGFKVKVKSAYTYSSCINESLKFNLQSIFDTEFLEGFTSWSLKKGAPGATIKFLEWVISEAKPNTFTSHYSIPEDCHSYNEWIEELSYICFIAKEKINEIKSNYVAMDGKRNVNFIINANDPWSAYFDLVDMIKKIISIKGYSLWSHASYLAFRWMIYAPLRVRNISMLKWLGVVSEKELIRFEENKEIGIFKLAESGEFGVFVHKSHLKNKGSSAAESIYQEFPGMKCDFDNYLKIRERESLKLGVTTELWAFGVSDRAFNGAGGRVRPTHVGNELVKITQQALSVLYPDEHNPGINPHAMRHLAATLFLNDNPENYTGLATLLMDRLDTVIAVYAKINNKQNAKKIREWANKRMTDAI
ncbi:hypothetical protein [Paraglaciecola polaris]|uniref:Uncharacterized protein n=1 Tax=Paraglaciecola polaris LMG 21857 TaxID=1129793 RepID=K6ZI22_9ALTE|nr:hypothetical protein [Paraglaciecola polaris]GAC35646.1 hypothetical protein GPLA_4772 [Paraglaciecola polaris LMG 21857]